MEFTSTLALNMEIPGFSRCQRFIYMYFFYLYLVITFIGQYYFYCICLFLSPRIWGGSFLKFPGCVFARKGSFYDVAFLWCQFFNEVENFYVLCLLNLNSLHHGKEQVHNGGEEVQGVYPIILFSFNIH